MSLPDVVHGNFRRLVDSVRQVNVGGRTSVHIRINVSWRRTFFFFFSSRAHFHTTDATWSPESCERLAECH
jgi:hypothetical protein